MPSKLLSIYYQPQAFDAFTLKADLQFMQHLKEYNEASAALVNSAPSIRNPTLINQKARQGCC